MDESQYVQTKASPVERCIDMLLAWISAPDGTDVQVRGGHARGGEPAIAFFFSGGAHYFTLHEAEKAVSVLREVGDEFPDMEETCQELAEALEEAIEARKRVVNH